MTLERLQKVLAHAGIASRRACERLIVEGHVAVNGRTVTELGTKVDPQADAIRVDGKRVAQAPRQRTYLLLNKPRGVVTTLSDPEGRPTVKDLLRGIRSRVYPVGRLDYDSEGLLVCTDDGDLSRRLMHPSSGVVKTYLAKVRGEPSPEVLARLARGVRLEGRPTLPAGVRLARRGENPWVEVRIVEGRNRQVRKMLEIVGHPVMRLRRTGYGPLSIGKLRSGTFRALTDAEVEALRRSAGSVRP